MATYIDLDSTHRDREVFVNPAEYTVTSDQIEGWFKSARTVRANAQSKTTCPLEFVTSLNLKILTTPYDASFTTIPRLYVDFHCQSKNDIRLVSTINGVNPDAKFVLVQDKIQYDDLGNAVWIHWKSLFEQVTRFKRDEPVNFRVFTRNGITLPVVDSLPPLDPDPTKQVMATFEIMPYMRDGEEYSNHLLDYTQ